MNSSGNLPSACSHCEPRIWESVLKLLVDWKLQIARPKVAYIDISYCIIASYSLNHTISYQLNHTLSIYIRTRSYLRVYMMYHTIYKNPSPVCVYFLEVSSIRSDPDLGVLQKWGPEKQHKWVRTTGLVRWISLHGHSPSKKSGNQATCWEKHVESVKKYNKYLNLLTPKKHVVRPFFHQKIQAQKDSIYPYYPTRFFDKKNTPYHPDGQHCGAIRRFFYQWFQCW